MLPHGQGPAAREACTPPCQWPSAPPAPPAIPPPLPPGGAVGRHNRPHDDCQEAIPRAFFQWGRPAIHLSGPCAVDAGGASEGGGGPPNCGTRSRGSSLPTTPLPQGRVAISGACVPLPCPRVPRHACTAPASGGPHCFHLLGGRSVSGAVSSRGGSPGGLPPSNEFREGWLGAQHHSVGFRNACASML